MKQFRRILVSLVLVGLGSCEWGSSLDTYYSDPVAQHHFGHAAWPIGPAGLQNIASSGESVLLWQSLLGSWGASFSCAALDGQFGPQTIAATQYWQIAQNGNPSWIHVRTDGVVDKPMWDAIFYDHMRTTSPFVVDQFYNKVPEPPNGQVVVVRTFGDDHAGVNPPERTGWFWDTQNYLPDGFHTAKTWENLTSTSVDIINADSVGCSV